jgi:hypothetical protein
MENIDIDPDIVKIDQLALDKECIQLPSDYLKYALLSADLKQEVDNRKARLDSVEAEMSRQIRNTPGKFGLEKVTESAIKEVIQTSEQYQKALVKLNNAKHAQDRAQATVWALEHKKRSLVLLVDLHGMGYFSNPRLSQVGKKVVEQMTKESVRPRRRAMEE